MADRSLWNAIEEALTDGGIIDSDETAEDAVNELDNAELLKLLSKVLPSWLEEQ